MDELVEGGLAAKLVNKVLEEQDMTVLQLRTEPVSPASPDVSTNHKPPPEGYLYRGAGAASQPR